MADAYEQLKYCNDRRTLSDNDFRYIPMARIYVYKDHCYDLADIAVKFNRGCFMPGHYFHIVPGRTLSFKTMTELANKK